MYGWRKEHWTDLDVVGDVAVAVYVVRCLRSTSWVITECSSGITATLSYSKQVAQVTCVSLSAAVLNAIHPSKKPHTASRIRRLSLLSMQTKNEGYTRVFTYDSRISFWRQKRQSERSWVDAIVTFSGNSHSVLDFLHNILHQARKIPKSYLVQTASFQSC